MNLLSKSNVEKLDKSCAKVVLSSEKLTVSPMPNGKFTLNFPLTFSCYKTVNLSMTAKKYGEGEVTVGVRFLRRGKEFGEQAAGAIAIDGDNYVQYELHFFIPFGVDEAMIALKGREGASVSVLKMNVEVEFSQKASGEGVCCIADGGLSVYAPKNTMSAFLSAKRAGFKSVIVDADVTADGVIYAGDGQNLSFNSDGEGFASDKTFEELKKLDFGMFADPFYKNTRASTVKEVLMQFSGEGITPYIRIHKPDFPFEKLGEEMAELSFEEVRIIPRTVEDAVKAKDAMPFVKLATISDDRGGAVAQKPMFAELYAKFGDEVEALRCADYPDELCKILALGEKKLVTKCYQLDGCKLK